MILNSSIFCIVAHIGFLAIQDRGRQNILNIAQNQHFSLRHEVTFKPKYKKDQTFERIEIVTPQGVIGAFSKSTSQRLYRMQAQVKEVTCVRIQIIDYYQADKTFYERANYQGQEQSHYVFIPALKIRRAL